MKIVVACLLLILGPMTQQQAIGAAGSLVRNLPQGKVAARVSNSDSFTYIVKNLYDSSVSCELDGEYIGTVGGYGRLEVHPVTGVHTFTGKSRDGKYKWGPHTFTINDSNVEYTEELSN